MADNCARYIYPGEIACTPKLIVENESGYANCIFLLEKEVTLMTQSRHIYCFSWEKFYTPEKQQCSICQYFCAK